MSELEQIVKNFKKVLNESYNDELLKERALDAINAIKDVQGYLKELGIGDEDDLETLSSAIEVLENYNE